MAQEKLTFRAPDESAFTNYVTAVLEEAYRELGIQLEYIELPRIRGEQLAAEGTIAGELGRTPSLEASVCLGFCPSRAPSSVARGATPSAGTRPT